MSEDSPLDNPELMEQVAKLRREAEFAPVAILGLWVDAPKGMPHVTPKPGSEKRHCDGCGSHLWVGPEQLKVVNGPLESVVVCFGCALTLGLVDESASNLTPLSDTSHKLTWPRE